MNQTIIIHKIVYRFFVAVCLAVLILCMRGSYVHADSYMGIEMLPYHSAEDLTADMIADRAAQVMNYARTHGYQYVHSTSVPPCADGIISCDRLTAAVLWSCGMTDQPRGGITLDNGYDGYLTGHGFIRSTGIGELKRGSIVKVSNGHGGTHMFICTDWDGSTLIRCDAGWQGGITGIQQPFAGRFFWDPASAVIYNVPDLPVNDWKVTGEGTRYYDENREPLKGLQEIDGNTYYFSEADSLMQTGMILMEDGWRYFDDDGIMQKGLQRVQNEEANLDAEFYFNEDGIMQTGIQNVDGMICYFGKDGKRGFGFHKSDGRQYYLTRTGAFTGWKTIKGKTYYFSDEESGAAVTGWQKLDGARYYFDKKSVMQTGWQEIAGKTYYFTEKGACAEGWLTLDRELYYFTEDGMQTGWLELQDGSYYLHADGTAARGLVTVDGTRYYFTPENGLLYAGWHEDGNRKMYFTDKGAVVNHFRVIDGHLYHFDLNGALSKGWFRVDAKAHFAGEDGIVMTGWNVLDNCFVFFNRQGALKFRIPAAAAVCLLLAAAAGAVTAIVFWLRSRRKRSDEISGTAASSQTAGFSSG